LLGIVGGVPSVAARVVTGIGSDAADVFSAASTAATAYVYVVEGLRPLSANDGVLEVPIKAVFRNT
jgi:hypothetical protein